MSIRYLVFGTHVFGVNVIDAVLNGTNYVHSLKGYLILANAIEKLKLEDFLKCIDPHEFSGFSKVFKSFQIALASKNPEESKSSYHVCLNQCQVIKEEFETFSKTCSERSEICRHWDGILTLIGLLKDLVAADSEGNWEVHLQVIQKLLPVFFNVR